MNSPKEHFENVESHCVYLKPRKYEIVYVSLIVLLYTHIAGLYGGYLLFTKAKWMTILLASFTYNLGLLGVIVGSHRLWSHMSFKATLPLEIFLMFCHSVACQYSAYEWVRNHRLHHKCGDTDADPHNPNRGFFFSHIGWLIVKKHPEVKKRGAIVDMEDIRTNPVLDFQKRHSKWFLITAGFILPTIIPVLLWNEDFSTSWHLNLLRYVLNLNIALSGNSFAHLWGYKPYDAKLSACQNLALTIFTYGEGFHNFHHAFPYDYRAAEKGYNRINLMTMFIDVCAKLGLAYDLKEVSEEIIMKRMKRSGDGSDQWGMRNI